MATLESDYYFWFEGFMALHPDHPMKFTSRRPNTVSGRSRIMALSIKVPKSLFDTPEISASVTVTEEQARTLTINTQAAADALSEVIGAQVSLTVKTADDLNP